MNRSVAIALSAMLFTLACAHQVDWIGGQVVEPVAEPSRPLPLTLVVGSIVGDPSAPSEAWLERLAARLRSAHLFEEVAYPAAAGAPRTLELRLRVRESPPDVESADRDAPRASFLAVNRESVFGVDVEARLGLRGRLLKSYQASGRVRYRYQPFASRSTMEAEGLDLIMDRVVERIAADLAVDVPQIERASRIRFGH